MINKEYERRYHVRRDDVRGKTDFDIHSRQIAEAVRANDKEVIAAGKPMQFEEWVPADDGDRFYLSSKFLLRDSLGQPYAVCGTATDITLRIETELELRQTEEAMREAQAALSHVSRVTTVGELAASITHELNQPLTGVISNSHARLRWLETTPPNLEEVRQGVERTLRDGTRAAEVITKIRSLLRRTTVEMEPVNINDAIQEVVALAQPEVRKNGVKLRIDLDPALPSVIGDRVLLQQVILNLLINGIEAVAPVEREHRKLQISSHRSAPCNVLIAVSDTGVGIGEKSFEDISKAFFITKPNGMGMGIALPTNHHSPITFTFPLPLCLFLAPYSAMFPSTPGLIATRRAIKTRSTAPSTPLVSL